MYTVTYSKLYVPQFEIWNCRWCWVASGGSGFHVMADINPSEYRALRQCIFLFIEAVRRWRGQRNLSPHEHRSLKTFLFCYKMFVNRLQILIVTVFVVSAPAGHRPSKAPARIFCSWPLSLQVEWSPSIILQTFLDSLRLKNIGSRLCKRESVRCTKEENVCFERIKNQIIVAKDRTEVAFLCLEMSVS